MGTLLTLTPFEYGILGKLISQPRRVFSRESLLYEVWTDSEDTSDRVIDTHIKSIRSKLRTVDPTRHPIRTHRSFGYSLEETLSLNKPAADHFLFRGSHQRLSVL